MLMENNSHELERHKAATVSLASTASSSSLSSVSSPPPQKIAAASNATVSMPSTATEPHPSSSMKRSHTIASSIMTDIEQTITILLTCTKKFLEALTTWSLGQMSNDQVMAIYKDLADQFDRVKQALQAAQLTMSDVAHIPDQLHGCLAATLDNPPSKTALEQHLPTIRDIILRLLQSLKRKQAQLREAPPATVPSRRISGGSSTTSSTSSSSSPVSSPRASHRPSPPLTSHSKAGGGGGRSSDLDMTDVNTQNALDALKQQDNLARRSSVRRANTLHSGGNSPVIPPRRHPTLIRRSNDGVPPPPNLSPRQRLSHLATTTAITANAEEEKEKKAGNLSGAFPLFLQMGDQVKKMMWQQHEPVTPAALGMAFLEKFDLPKNDGSDKADIGIIKIQDPVSRIMYELEDMNDVGPHAFLSLASPVSPPSSSTMSSHPITTTISSSSSSSQGNVDMLSAKLDRIYQELRDYHERICQNQRETSASYHHQQAAEAGVVSSSNLVVATSTSDRSSSRNNGAEVMHHTIFQQQQDEIEHLRRDLGVLRQVAKEFQEETTALLLELKNTAAAAAATTTSNSTTATTTACSPSPKTHNNMLVMHRHNPEGGNNSNSSNQRSYVVETKQRAETVANSITGRMQDLQDTIDQLKLDVTQRRCRPSQAQLDHCQAEGKALEGEIERLSELIRSVKPTWKATWEAELQTVVKEQQFLKDQEALLLDLRDDHADLLHVLQQLQKISEIQARGNGKKKIVPPLLPSSSSASLFRGGGGGTGDGDGSSSPASSIISSSTATCEEEAMSNVLKQVSTIEVDHGRRVKALQQAEKMRARELANRIDDFERELSSFVESKKLKKTGGADHVDRQRQKKDQQILRDLYQSKTHKKTNNNNNNDTNITK